MYFVFNHSNYLQVQGAAMGTCWAPSYTNLYLGGGSRNFLQARTSQYTCAISFHGTGILRTSSPYGMLTSLSSKIFFIFWTSIISIWNLRLHMTNQKNKFFRHYSISLGRWFFRSTLYRKPSEVNTLLHKNSFHPQIFMWSKYLRIRHNSSSEEEFLKESDKLCTWLLERGYKKTTLRKVFNKAKNKSRQKLLFSARSKIQESHNPSHQIHLTTSGGLTNFGEILGTRYCW